jgi:hypothetical protein
LQVNQALPPPLGGVGRRYRRGVVAALRAHPPTESSVSFTTLATYGFPNTILLPGGSTKYSKAMISRTMILTILLLRPQAGTRSAVGRPQAARLSAAGGLPEAPRFALRWRTGSAHVSHRISGNARLVADKASATGWQRGPGNFASAASALNLGRALRVESPTVAPPFALTGPFSPAVLPVALNSGSDQAIGGAHTATPRRIHTQQPPPCSGLAGGFYLLEGTSGATASAPTMIRGLEDANTMRLG